MVRSGSGFSSDSGSSPEAETSAQEKSKVLDGSYSYRTYSFRENLFAEFDRLIEEGRLFDGLIIDLMQVGYTLSLDTLVKFHFYSKRLLKPNGVLLFVKPDGALSLTRDDLAGGLTFNVYDSPFGIFARYPMLADYVCATVSGIDRRRLREGGSTLANHILLTSIPVLTKIGLQAKRSATLAIPQEWVLLLIDDYTTVEAITQSIEKQYNVPADEAVRLLQEIESDKLIYPIFSRIQFLSNCYHNRKPFRLGRYLVAAGFLNDDQLKELLEIQAQEGWGRSKKTFLGVLAVKAGFLNTRELEVLLNDQYLYGGHKTTENDAKRGAMSLETVKDSMIGSLGAIDAGGLLQSLAGSKKTGILTVESQEKIVSVLFSNGLATHGLLGKLSGYDAVVEFLTTWEEGIFVFRDKGTSADMVEACKLNKSLERTLLDAALFQDQINQIFSQLPNGSNTVLERVDNAEALWNAVTQQPLKYLDGTAYDTADISLTEELIRRIDGLTVLDEVIKAFDMWPTYKIIRVVKLLLEHNLLEVQQTSLFKPLTVFQFIAGDLRGLLGTTENKVLLEESLQQTYGNSEITIFRVDHEGRVSIDLGKVKQSGLSVSKILFELRRWMEDYLLKCRQQIDPKIVNSIVTKSINAAQF